MCRVIFVLLVGILLAGCGNTNKLTQSIPEAEPNTGTLTGYVKQSSSFKYIANAKVELASQNDPTRFVFTVHGYTNKYGYFQIPVRNILKTREQGIYVMRISAHGYLPYYERNVYLINGMSNYLFTFELSKI